MTKNKTLTLDEIIDFVNSNGYTGGDNELRQSTLQWVADTLIPEYETDHLMNETLGAAEIRNDEHKQIRLRLKDYGWKEPS